MSGVQRFDAVGGTVNDQQHGEYVRHYDFARVSAELAAAREELAALRKDADRLDYLLNNQAVTYTDGDGHWWVSWDWVGGGPHRVTDYCPSQRDAIDAAIALQESRE